MNSAKPPKADCDQRYQTHLKHLKLKGLQPKTFSQNHKQLQGSPGAVAVLHTHSRTLGFHPHVHVVMPAAALDADQGL